MIVLLICTLTCLVLTCLPVPLVPAVAVVTVAVGVAGLVGYAVGYRDGTAPIPRPWTHAVNPIRTPTQVLQEVDAWQRPRPVCVVYVLYDNHGLVQAVLGRE